MYPVIIKPRAIRMLAASIGCSDNPKSRSFGMHLINIFLTTFRTFDE